MSQRLPLVAAEITAEWLSATLAPVLPPGCTIRTVALTPFGHQESFSGGRLYRIVLGYHGASGAAPASLVAKFSPLVQTRASALFAANQREVAFYATLAAQRTLSVPQCYFAASDPDRDATLILLQDLQGARAVPFADGLSHAKAAVVIDTLAHLHASWWQDPRLATLSGSSILAEFGFSACWAQYPERVAELLPDIVLPRAFRVLGDHLVRDQGRIFGELFDRGPLTCLHGDVHADNLMFGPDGRAILYDWQMMGRGRGGSDVGYFLISSLAPDVRRMAERDLVARYHQRLLTLDVAGYSLADCQADCMRAFAYKFFVTVVATLTFESASAHKRAWRRTDLQRLLSFCEDHAISPQSFS